VAWGALESARGAATLAALESAAQAAPGFALAQILLGEAMVARGVRRRQTGAGLLEQAIPALHRVLSADPERDPEPAARVFGWFHRGRVELALPAVLGRKDRGVAALERALAALAEAGGALDAAAKARVEANARLALGRHWLSAGDEARGKALLAEAAAMDPEGPIARMAREEG
jgi:tetratricopeptide (TPR) repeat protein